eukprot:714833-Rhodomonas_salina.1
MSGVARAGQGSPTPGSLALHRCPLSSALSSPPAPRAPHPPPPTSHLPLQPRALLRACRAMPGHVLIHPKPHTTNHNFSALCTRNAQSCIRFREIEIDFGVQGLDRF